MDECICLTFYIKYFILKLLFFSLLYMQRFLFLQQHNLWGNSLWMYVVAIGIFFLTIIILKIIKVLFLGYLKQITTKTKTHVDDIIVTIFDRIRWPIFVLVGLYLSMRALILPDIWNRIVLFFVLLVTVYEVLRIVDQLSIYFLKEYSYRHGGVEGINTSFVQAGRLLLRIVFWSLGFLFVLSNLHVNVSSLIASLGIGGIAVALAAQSILSDIFSSFSIYIDRPFAIGDFITVGINSGTVKKIGLKSTRISTLRGEELIISNKELTTTRIQNFKRLKKRKQVTTVSVVYELSEETLAKIPSWIEEIIKKVEKAEFERCHFSAFSPYSIDFEIAYLVDSADYTVYMDTKQQVNLAIFSLFKKYKINFAYPTQFIYEKKV